MDTVQEELTQIRKFIAAKRATGESLTPTEAQQLVDKLKRNAEALRQQAPPAAPPLTLVRGKAKAAPTSTASHAKAAPAFTPDQIRMVIAVLRARGSIAADVTDVAERLLPIPAYQFDVLRRTAALDYPALLADMLTAEYPATKGKASAPTESDVAALAPLLGIAVERLSGVLQGRQGLWRNDPFGPRRKSVKRGLFGG